MKSIFCILILFAFQYGHAQTETWHPGVVVTDDDLVLTGNILYQATYELVVIRCADNPVAHVVQAQNLKLFRFYDESANINRKFISSGNTIYEEVVAGRIAVWRKSKHGLENGDDRDDFLYFFYDNQEVHPLMKFRSVLYPKISNLLALQEKNLHLNPNRLADAVRYIQLYNERFSTFYTLGALR